MTNTLISSLTSENELTTTSFHPTAASNIHIDKDNKYIDNNKYNNYKCRNDFININVSGLLFTISKCKLLMHPHTLLGNPEKLKHFYDWKRNEYFFDRHRPTFECIFNYYHNAGIIRRPVNVPDDVFLQELEFFQLEKDIVDDYKAKEGYIKESIIVPTKKTKLTKLWILFEYPSTSTSAYCFGVLSVLLTVISIFILCIETLPKFKKAHCIGKYHNFISPFFIIESICTLWFSLEVIVRFFCGPSKKLYFRDWQNVIDLVAILPFYVSLVGSLVNFSCHGSKSSALAFLRVIRLMRIFKLTKHSRGLQVLLMTFRASLHTLSLFVVALSILVVLFSSTLYYVEISSQKKNGQPNIASIPHAFWWAIVTMCTVGYGDLVPKHPIGKIVGSICTVAGVLTLAIPVPIITENFNKFYSHKLRKKNLRLP